MTMTVRDLLALLDGIPPDTRVLVEGYETGYSDPTLLPEHEYDSVEWHASYEGPYERTPLSDVTIMFRGQIGEPFRAVVLSRHGDDA